MLTILSALGLRIFSNPYSNVLQKKLTQSGVSPEQINFMTYMGLSLFCLIFVYNIDIIPQAAWLYGVIGGLLGALGNAFLIKALKYGELSVLGPINSYKPIVAMILGIFILGEFPSLLGLFGIFLIIGGSYFIFDKGSFNFDIFGRKDVQYRFLALICTGCEAVFIKNVINLTDITVSFVFWCLFGFIFSSLFTKLKFKAISENNMFVILGLIISMGVMQWSTNFVFQHMNVSYALALFQLSTLLSVFLGWKVFKEKHTKRRLLGAVIMMCGAIVLILA